MSDPAPNHALPFYYALLPPRFYLGWRARRVVRKARRSQNRRHEQEIGLLPFLVPSQSLALDVGANRGVYTHFLSPLCPQVIAYEPNPWCARFLERGAPANCTVRPVAVSDRSGRSQLRIPFARDKEKKLQHNVGTLVPSDPESSSDLTIEVPKIALDDESFDLPIGFIKIDVEEHELEVLQGARKLLMRDRPNLLVEILDAAENPVDHPVLSLLESLGYTGFALAGGRHLHHLSQIEAQNLGRNILFFPAGKLE